MKNPKIDQDDFNHVYITFFLSNKKSEQDKL